MTYIYTIVHFGCNSSYNDMWIPNVFIYKSYDEAFSKYTEIYDKLLYEVKYLCEYKGHYNCINSDHDKESCDNKQIYDEQIHDNEFRCFIQRGGDEGIKRPEGVKFVRTLIN
jgi:hypothetical protein